MDRSQFAEFLRCRREALQPEDVGLPRRPRRRARGLRREEVAELSGMSTDYYARLERGAGPQPSEQMIAAIARGLRLSLPERDHLFLLAGHDTPRRSLRADHIGPGLMRILDRLQDTPAQIMGSLGETLVQTRPAMALLGDETHHTGPARSAVYRWFTDPSSRLIHPASDHPVHGRIYTAQLRRAAARQGPHSPAAALVRRLLDESEEFAVIWNEHQVGLTHTDAKRFVHPEVGELTLHCQTLLDPDQEHALLVFTATPGTESHDKLKILEAVGTRQSTESPGALQGVVAGPTEESRTTTVR
ncbi:helix-turn-helix transcriptional regulator [Streptomyces sp. NPDC007264]|uniref:helix-turn-helix transcriptional regulator n=1 Tax=Streptomyces sp. NPDC007264 TaxID=3364777 RepID=UPI0036DE3489